MEKTIEYRGYTITGPYLGTWPYSLWKHEYEFCHKEIDGAPDAHDNRLGSGTTLEDCKEQIHEIDFDRLANDYQYYRKKMGATWNNLKCLGYLFCMIRILFQMHRLDTIINHGQKI